MKMRHIIIYVFSIAMTSITPVVRATDDLELSTQTVNIATSSGPVTQTTMFRGTSKIMSTLSFTNKTTRTLIHNSDARIIESDEDGDGFFESIILPGRDMTDFEALIRLRDGSVVPLNSEDYTEMKSKINEATMTLIEALNQDNTE